MDTMEKKNIISEGRAVLGIELGSTRIKAVLIDSEGEVLSQGGHSWENHLEDGIWTYPLDEVWTGLRDAYSDLCKNVKDEFGTEITALSSIGVSAMMHGYLAFNENDELLVPFRTWRNTVTGEAADQLTEAFQFNIPQRWSAAHLYQAVLNGEEHVKDVRFITTLSGYIHWQLTGEKVLGIGDASGMFPIDSETLDYDSLKMAQFEDLLADKKFAWKARDIFPKVLAAGNDAGTLTEKGAKLLDPSGKLAAGAPMCPPEGDAGTGMVATNSIAVRTGNVSAGTSVFGMVVLEKPLKALHRELDMVTTPDGFAVAMAHVNNCTSEINSWMGLFREVLTEMGVKDVDMGSIYEKMFLKSLEGDKDAGGLLSYGFFSGEHVMELSEGRPLFVRRPDAAFNLANFMKMHIMSAFGVLKIGMDILMKEENVPVDSITGHGGIFKTKGVAQKVLAAALDTPVSVMENAGEGGAWGIALLASFGVNRKDNEKLPDFLNRTAFKDSASAAVMPDKAEVEGYEKYMEMFRGAAKAERAAVESI